MYVKINRKINKLQIIENTIPLSVLKNSKTLKFE